jgi:hypothetical protein
MPSLEVIMCTVKAEARDKDQNSAEKGSAPGMNYFLALAPAFFINAKA